MTARLTTIARRDAALSVDAPSAGAPSAGASGDEEARGDRPRSGTEACSVHPGLPRSSFRLSSTSVTTPCVKYSRTSPSHSRLNSSSVLIAGNREPSAVVSREQKYLRRRARDVETRA